MTARVIIHPTAEVAPEAEIGPGSRIWQHCVVLKGARIGARAKLGHNVFVEGGVVIGHGVTVKDNVVLYDGVELEDDVFVGPGVVFTNVLAPRAFVSRKAEFLPTRVCQGASIGANATIVCGVAIGRYAMICAGAVVARDVAPHALVVGNPAERIGWVSRAGHRLGADLVCPASGARHAVRGDALVELREA